MLHTRVKWFTGKHLPAIVLLLACCFLAALLLTVKPNVFFSGDAGLKFLVIKQINTGGEYSTLRLEEPVWVQKIWQEGYYPFKEPFIYNTKAGKVVAFPPAFQLLNAPLYHWFGYRGLYIIPCMSLILLWLWFINTLRRLGTRSGVIAGGLFLMVFCSPLTLYAAVYWEHTLAILLVFGGVVFLVRQPRSHLLCITLGFITGFSAWFRPETILLSGMIAAVSLYNLYRYKKAANLFFILGYLAVIIAFLIFNTNVYGNALGAHAYQVIENKSFNKGVADALVILTHVNAKLFLFFPAAGLFYLSISFLLIKKPAIQVLICQLSALIILYSLLTPWILPNAGGKQWGPRYFLPLIPLILVTMCLIWDHVSFGGKWKILIIPIIVYSCYLNVFKSSSVLKNDYSYRVSPGLNLLKDLNCDVVVVQNQYIAQEFSAAFEKNKFFLAENDVSFNSLLGKLRVAGVRRFVYIDVKDQGKSLPNSLNQGKSGLIKVNGYFFAEYLLR